MPRWPTKQTRHQHLIKVCNNSYLTLTTMARLQGISGGMSGRTGSFTYRQSRGQTIVSQYQPIVKNPNTEGQQNQRARFKLMSQLAAIMAPGFGTMGITKRPGKQRPTQRNAFMNINMPAAIVDNGTAKIQMEAIKLTTSNTPLGTITQANESVTIENIPSQVTSVRVVEVQYVQYNVADTSTGSFIIKTRAEVKRIVDVPVTGGIIDFDTSNGSTILAYGLIPSESLSGVDFDNIHTPNDEAFISAVDLNTLVSQGLMAETMTLGINVSASAGV